MYRKEGTIKAIQYNDRILGQMFIVSFKDIINGLISEKELEFIDNWKQQIYKNYVV